MVAFGVHAGPEGCSMEDLCRAWRRFEELGFEWISVWDHFFPMLQPRSANSFDALVSHAALATVTTRPRLGSGVYSVGYRHPATLARAAVTIDHLSQGRMELGIGAGWFEEEYEAFGFDFEAPLIRLRRLKEAAEIIRLLWTEESVDYDGEFYRLRGASCHPKPYQEKPRLWLGTPGEKVGIKMAAQVANGWNCSGVSAADFARKRSILMEAAPDPSAMTTAVQVGVLITDGDVEEALERRRSGNVGERVDRASGIAAGSVAEVTDTLAEYVDAGADWVIVRAKAPFDFEELERFVSEVVPHFKS